jgi:hypothetical protein
MRRAFGEAAMSVGALTVLMLTLIAFDDRVREQISLRFSARPAQELAEAGRQVRDLTAIVISAAHDQSIEHAPLVIFVLAAIVLVLFMLRT